jgi:ubiquinone/menaquinone biosynthesis C-methylase UbiE
MFIDSAKIYDFIYSIKDYQKEALEVISMIRSRKPQAKTILDVGCGTAEHHRHLKKEFLIDGLDINEEYIRAARTKNEAGSYYVMDMVDFHLSKKYDVILCLFSAIGYILTMDKVISMLKHINEHLIEGGLVIVEPWFTPDTWKTGKLHMLTYDKDDIKISRMNISETIGRLAVVNFHYLLGTPDNGVQHFEERHEFALFSQDEIQTAFEEAGFEVSYDEKGLIGRGMYFGTKSSFSPKLTVR